MTTPHRTLLQQALDALTNCLSEHGHRCNRCDSEIDEGGKLITALREALAAPEPDLDGDNVLWLWRDGDRFLAYRHLYPCYSPGGDPMTLGEPFGKAIFRHSHDRSAAPGAAPPAAPAPAAPVPDGMVPNADEVICPNCAHQFRAIPENVQSLLLAAGHEPPFTASPAAPVVPLTDELIDYLWRLPMSADWDHREFARAIEAAHGITGGSK